MSALFLLGLCLENNFDGVQTNNQGQIREESLRRIRKICSHSKKGVLRETRATLICVVLPSLIQAAQLGDVPFRSTMENSVDGQARCPAGLSAGSLGGSTAPAPSHPHPCTGTPQPGSAQFLQPIIQARAKAPRVTPPPAISAPRFRQPSPAPGNTQPAQTYRAA